MNEIKFYRGEQRHYQYDVANNIFTHKDGIFFATDTSKILVNGHEFGGKDLSGDILKLVASVDFNFDPKTLKNQLILKNSKGEQLGKPVDLDIVIPYAKYSKAENSEIIEYTDGLLRGEDKERIDRYEKEIKELQGLKIVKLETPTEGSEATYKLQGAAEDSINIEIPIIDRIDSTLHSVQLGTTLDTVNPETGEVIPGEGETDALVFVYLLNNGEYELVSVPLDKYLRESEFKSGLSVSPDGEVSVNISEETEESKNFLILEEESSLAVREIDADCSKLTDDIIIAGGPLAGFAEKVYPGGKIPVGTDMQSLLSKLFCTELWPDELKYQTGKFKVSIEKPEISVKDGEGVDLASGTNLYVGSSISFTSEAKEAKYTSKSTDNIVSGFTYGYSKDLEKTETSQNTSIKTSWTGEPVETDTYVFSAILDGFSEAEVPGVTGSDYTTLTLAAENLIVSPGENIIKVSESGIRFIGSIEGIESHYACSNLKNVEDEEGNVIKSKEIPGQSEVMSETPQVSSEFKIIGVLPCFCNILDGEFTETPETRIEMILGNEVILDVPGESGNMRFQFSYPSDRTATLYVKNLDGTFVEYSAEYRTDLRDDTKEFGGISYNILKTEGPAQGAGTYKIILGKALNE